MQTAATTICDSLENPPLNTAGDGVMRFDVTLANPPFSASYNRNKIPLSDRFWGFPPEKGKGDLMFVQHIISTLPQTGRAAIMLPHGVLFRGNAEQVIRQQMVEADLIEAIIGLPAGLFGSTGIPTFILVINKAKDAAMRGQVLFVDAKNGFQAARAQNHLRPEDVEKIAVVLAERREISGYSQLVNLAEMADNDYNLNIPRYVSHFEEEPHDVVAHLLGGYPQAEVEQCGPLLARVGVDVNALFEPLRPGYLAFVPTVIGSKSSLSSFVHQAASETRERHYALLADWWQAVGQGEIIRLHEAGRAGLLMEAQRRLKATLKQQLSGPGVLDEFAIAGAFSAWWQHVRADWRTPDPARAIPGEGGLTALAKEVDRYLSGAERTATAALKKLWDKYAVSMQQIDAEVKTATDRVNEMMAALYGIEVG